MSPSFDLAGLLKTSLALEEATSVDPHLFSLSPFSSPDVTPNQSPSTSPVSTPTELPRLGPAPPPTGDPIFTLPDTSAAMPPMKESSRRKSCKKEQSKANCRDCRQAVRTKNFGVIDIREDFIEKYVTGAVPLVSEMVVQETSVAKTGYVAIDD